LGNLGGRGGSLHAGASAAGGPTLIYQCGAIEISVSGDNLTAGPATPAGMFVVVLIKKAGIVPGRMTSIGVLFPTCTSIPPSTVHMIASRVGKYNVPLVARYSTISRVHAVRLRLLQTAREYFVDIMQKKRRGELTAELAPIVRLLAAAE
jgi:hypothetical protein